MTTARPMPQSIARLSRDKHGRPIPWFVHIEDGVPDFRVIRRGGIEDAVRFGLCWVCGRQRGRHAAFVVGPMCAVNRTSAEPPSHLECALFSARACPFLTTPAMRRRERGLEHVVDPAGVMIGRNPGVALVWSSRTWRVYGVPRSAVAKGVATAGRLFDLGEPTAVSWWAQGRPATREEVLASMESGLPLLRAEAEKQRGGAEELARMVLAARDLVPA